MTVLPRETWASGDLYEPYVGRWSRLVARDFVEWLGIRPRGRWLDVGCGTGALAGEALARTEAAVVVGLDHSEGYARYAARRLAGHGALFAAADAAALPIAGARFDVAVSGLVLNFVPSPVTMLGEMRRATATGGAVGVYVWDYAGAMQLMRHFWDAAVALDPAAAELDEGRRFRMCEPQSLAELSHAAGMPVVDTRAIDVPTVFRDFDDYWTPFLGGQAPAPGYCMSLPEERRVARAWAAKARVA